MAKRRSGHHKKRGRRRRRVGAVSMKSLTGKTGIKLLSVAAGIAFGKQINAQIDKMNTKTDASGATTTRVPTSMLTLGEIGIGGLLMMYKKSGTTGTVVNVVGGVLAGVGVRRALAQAGIMAGFQSVPVIGRHRMAGFQSVPVIGNRRMPTQLSGRVPSQLQGFRVNGYIPTGSGVGAMGSVPGGSGISTGSGYMG